MIASPCNIEWSSSSETTLFAGRHTTTFSTNWTQFLSCFSPNSGSKYTAASWRSTKRHTCPQRITGHFSSSNLACCTKNERTSSMSFFRYSPTIFSSFGSPSFHAPIKIKGASISAANSLWAQSGTLWTPLRPSLEGNPLPLRCIRPTKAAASASFQPARTNSRRPSDAGISASSITSSPTAFSARLEPGSITQCLRDRASPMFGFSNKGIKISGVAHLMR